MTEEMLRRIYHTIEKFHMIEPGMRIVTGVSGGADSVCLLYVLCQYRRIVPFELMAVHVEHGIRGEESLADAAYTQELCRSFDVPFCMYQIPVQKIAKETGMSVEEAGRMERYRCFQEVCDEWKGDRIAVAHNQNDQAETVLWNLVRGSGVKGLGGIRPVRDRIIRPLLYTSRKEIEEILERAGIAWRTDRTNLTEDYTRNKIRLSLLPQMEQGLNAKAVWHMARAAEELQKIQDFLKKMAEKEAENCLHSDKDSVILELAGYQKTDELIRMEVLKLALQQLLEGRGLKDIGRVHLEMLDELAFMDCGKECHLPGKIRVVREQGILRFESGRSRRKEKKQSGSEAGTEIPETEEWQIPISGTETRLGLKVTTELLLNKPALKQEIREEKKYTKWLNYDIINSNVLLRTRRIGDYLIVDDAGGRKKLKDYFIDRKIPRDMRDQIWLLADGSHILWVVGYRISEAAKVKENTEKILKIQVEDLL